MKLTFRDMGDHAYSGINVQHVYWDYLPDTLLAIIIQDRHVSYLHECIPLHPDLRMKIQKEWKP